MKRLIESFFFYSVRWTAVFLPVLVLIGLHLGGAWSLTGVGIIFGYYFLVEFCLWQLGLGIRTTKDDEFRFLNPEAPGVSDRYGVLIYGILQIVSLPFAIAILSQSHSLLEVCGGVLSLAVMVGSVGGLAGHEYIHRSRPLERVLGISIYGSLHYAHFKVSHLYGHHRSVGSHEDWSTSRYQETSYSFLWRALVHGYLGAWRLELERLRRQKCGFWSTSNFMLKASLGSLVLMAAIALALGWQGVVVHSLVSFLGLSLMEMVNYLSHYGLIRASDGGKRVPISDQHSWESNSKVTNWFIFNAGKHSHHHRVPSEHNYNLKLSGARAYLPYGLPMMTLIGLIPPLYFSVMDRLIYENTLETAVGLGKTAKSLPLSPDIGAC